MRLERSTQRRGHLRDTALLLAVVSGCDLGLVATAPRAWAQFELTGPGQIGAYADSAATVTAIWPQTAGPLAFHIVVRPPQTGMAACSFRVQLTLWPPPAGLERRLASGIEDLDPSDEGYDLRFAEGCLTGTDPVVLATYEFVALDRPFGTVHVTPRGTETLSPQHPAYVPCGTPVELPLRPNPYVCEYSAPGTLEINGGGCALIGIYWEGYASFLPHFAGLPARQVSVPILGTRSLWLGKESGTPCAYDLYQPVASFTARAQWDPQLATAVSLDPAPATRGWNMQLTTGHGELTIAADAGGAPLVAFDDTPVAYVTFQLADRLGWSGIRTTLSAVHDGGGNGCPSGWLSSSFLVGCTTGELTGDGEITAGDAVLALLMARGRRAVEYADLCAADIDGRMYLDAQDADKVLRLAVGLPTQGSAVVELYETQQPTGAEYVDLETDQVFGMQASVQYDASSLQFGSATCPGALVRARVVSPGVVHVALAADSAAPRTLQLVFAANGTHPPVRLVALRGFDQNGQERDVPYAFPDGVVAVETPTPAVGATRLLPAVPNPFNPRTMLRFVIARPGPVHLSIHDAAGRVVRSFARVWLEAGPHEVPWDGQDDSGHAAASGVYWLRLVAPDGIGQHRSVVLLR